MKNRTFAKSGVALVIVLGFLVILSALAVAFFSSVSTELKGARTFASGVTTRQLADSATNVVMAQIREATTRENACWASQPGMIRVYRSAAGDVSSNAESFIKLYSSDSMILTGNVALDNFLQIGDLRSDWDAAPALWTDLNSPVVVTDPTNPGNKMARYPIIDPAAMGPVQGFKFETNRVNGTVSTGDAVADRLPMPVRWIYVLQDGSMTVPDGVGTTVATWTGATKKPTKENPIVGRIAFWADDDSSKVNINTAAGFVNTPSTLPPGYAGDYSSYAGSYWDTPRYFTNFDYGDPDAKGLPKANQPSGGLALTQLLQGEFQRYPGHPATTSLGGIFGAYLKSEDLWRILPRISTANYQNVSSSSANAATAVDDYSYGTNGGTKRVMVGPVAAGGGSDNQNLLPKTKRLYASVDELLFASNPGGSDPTDPGYMRQSNDNFIGETSPNKLTPQVLERLRFFLTASSRAPELNLFGRPRVTVWPVRSETAAETTAANAASTGLNAYDKVMLFCSTIGPMPPTTATGARASDQAPGNSALPVPFRYIFTRRNATLSRDVGTDPLTQVADINLPRNKWLLQTYLSKLTQQNIPGFGGNLKTRLDSDGKANRDQLLVEIFDYIRCANLVDGTTMQWTPTKVDNQKKFAPIGVVAPSKIELQNGPTQTGMGRFPMIYDATIVYYYAGPTWRIIPKINPITLENMNADIPELADGLLHPDVFLPTDSKLYKYQGYKIDPLATGYNAEEKEARDKVLLQGNSLVGFPKFRQIRSFLLFSTFNPMFGYAPMANPDAASTAPKMTIEVSGMDGFQMSFGSVINAPLGYPAIDPVTGKAPQTVIYCSSGSAWTGRNMGGYEGFMHTLMTTNTYVSTKDGATAAGNNKNTLGKVARYFPVAGPADKYYLEPAFFGKDAQKGPQVANGGTQEYYPFQSGLLFNGPTEDKERAYIKTWTTDTTFGFPSNTITVKVWYDTYDEKASPVRTRPSVVNAKPYDPLQTIKIKFPGVLNTPGGGMAMPEGNSEDGEYDLAANRWGRADFNPVFDPSKPPKTPSNGNANLGSWYWTQIGSFYPSVGLTVPTSYTNESGVFWWNEFYEKSSFASAPKLLGPLTTPSTTISGIPSRSLKCGLEPAWSLASRINWASKNSDGPDRIRDASAGQQPPINWYTDRWRNIVQPGDIVRSVSISKAVGNSPTPTGDLRVAMTMTTIDDDLFNPHPDYGDGSKRRACGLRTGSGSVYFSDTTFGGLVYGGSQPFPASRAPANLPKGVKSVTRADGAQGDFDTGMGIFSDGPFANKQDEGNVVYAWWDELARVYRYPVPYFTDTWTYEKPGNTFTSPLRQMPSPVMMGSLPARAASLKGWETLCFAPFPGGSSHPGNVDPKDHLLLDLFNMPVVEPYPISEPFSTAGKINMNCQIVPFDYITRTTALRAAFAPIRVTGTETGDYLIYKSGTGGNRLSTNYRKILDCNTLDPDYPSLTMKAFTDFFEAGKSNRDLGMFKSASQICEMPLVPEGVTDIKTWWSLRDLTGDNVREKPYADLYPRLTTKSNTYTVHMRVQTLRQVPRATADSAGYATWQEGKDNVLGEYRGATTVERYVDPADRRFNQFDPTTLSSKDFINPDVTVYDPAQNIANGQNPTRSLENVYRFRSIMSKKFAP